MNLWAAGQRVFLTANSGIYVILTLFLRLNIKELARKTCVDGKEKTRRGRKAEGNASVKIFQEDFQNLIHRFLFGFFEPITTTVVSLICRKRASRLRWITDYQILSI